MHVEIPHQFTREEAARRVREALEEHREQIKMHASLDKEEWEGDTLHFALALQGKKVTGTLEVRDKEFVLDAELPLIWRMFEGRIERAIEEQVKKKL